MMVIGVRRVSVNEWKVGVEGKGALWKGFVCLLRIVC